MSVHCTVDFPHNDATFWVVLWTRSRPPFVPSDDVTHGCARCITERAGEYVLHVVYYMYMVDKVPLLVLLLVSPAYISLSWKSSRRNDFPSE